MSMLNVEPILTTLYRLILPLSSDQWTHWSYALCEKTLIIKVAVGLHAIYSLYSGVEDISLSIIEKYNMAENTYPE